MRYSPIDREDERIGKLIVDAAFAVHSRLGAGLLESVYEVIFCYELEKRGLACQRQRAVPLLYEELRFDEAFRLDVLVEGRVICELKAVETMPPVFMAQILTYLKLTERRLGYLINFNVPLIKEGIKRVVL